MVYSSFTVKYLLTHRYNNLTDSLTTQQTTNNLQTQNQLICGVSDNLRETPDRSNQVSSCNMHSPTSSHENNLSEFIGSDLTSIGTQSVGSYQNHTLKVGQKMATSYEDKIAHLRTNTQGYQNYVPANENLISSTEVLQYDEDTERSYANLSVRTKESTPTSIFSQDKFESSRLDLSRDQISFDSYYTNRTSYGSSGCHDQTTYSNIDSNQRKYLNYDESFYRKLDYHPQQYPSSPDSVFLHSIDQVLPVTTSCEVAEIKSKVYSPVQGFSTSSSPSSSSSTNLKVEKSKECLTPDTESSALVSSTG